MSIAIKHSTCVSVKQLLVSILLLVIPLITTVDEVRFVLWGNDQVFLLGFMARCKAHGP